jgi:chromosome segregation ATPase
MRLLVFGILTCLALPVAAQSRAEKEPDLCDLLTEVHGYFEGRDGRAALATLAEAYDVSRLQERSEAIHPEIERFRSTYGPLDRRRDEILLELNGPEGASLPPAPRSLDQVMGRLNRVKGVQPRLRYIDNVLLPWLETKKAGARRANKVQAKIDRLNGERRLLEESRAALGEDLEPIQAELRPLDARREEIRGLEREYEQLQKKISRTGAPLVGMNRAQDGIAAAISLCGEADAALRRSRRKAAMLTQLARMSAAAYEATGEGDEPLSPDRAHALARDCRCYTVRETRRKMRDRGLGRDTPEGLGMRDAAHELGVSMDCQAPDWSGSEYEAACQTG